MIWRCMLAVVVCCGMASAAEIQGKIVNAQGAEPLSKVRVSLEESHAVTITSPDGSFGITDIAPGRYTLRVEAIGFWLQRMTVEVRDATEVKDFSITLVPEGRRPTEVVEVTADRFAGPEPAQVASESITPGELRNSATVLAADPFRAIQTLPGVTASGNNDFFAQFTVWGAPYESVAVYLDGIELRQPFHGIPGRSDGASVSLLSNDMLESVTLTPAAFSERYSDGTGGALDMHTRDGSRTGPLVRASVGLVESHVTAEGALGNLPGSWLVAARRSYAGYLIHRSVADAIDVSIYDVAGKLTYDPSPRQTIEFYALDGHASLDRGADISALAVNQIAGGENTFSMARAGWRWAATHNLLLKSQAAWIRHRYSTLNPQNRPMTADYYGEWTGDTAAVWNWSANHVLEGGWTVRQFRDSSESILYAAPGTVPDAFISNAAEGTALRQGGYVQQSSDFFHHRLHLMTGVRYDRHSMALVQPVSPQASASFRVRGSTTILAGYGRYAQYPDVTQLFETIPPLVIDGVRYSVAEPILVRSTHYVAAVEQRIRESIRLRVDLYQRSNDVREGTRDPNTNGRGPVKPLPSAYSFFDSCDRSRGVQITLQRRSANHLSGWVGYTYGVARETNYGRLYRDQDQRHTLNVFGSYRLTATVSLSTKWLYGSGYPVETYYEVGATPQSSGAVRQIRLGPYERLDLRADKVMSVHRKKVTVYGEIMNLTNHHNLRPTGFGNFDPQTGRAPLIFERAIGFLPAAGMTIEF